MSDSTIKTIQLTGGVSMEMGGVTRKKGGGGKNKTKTYKIDRSEGGGSTSPGTLVQLTASSLPGKNGAPEPVGLNSRLTAAGAPLQIAGKRQSSSASTSTKAATASATAASTPVKVVLAAAKKKGRVILAAAKPSTQSSTRKASHSKKVRMTLSSLSRKIHKAKAIRKTATESTIEQIKKVLRSANLIKEGSKAPEPMLRQMYADYMTLKGRAL
jgi:hypothetical protein